MRHTLNRQSPLVRPSAPGVEHEAVGIARFTEEIMPRFREQPAVKVAG